MGKLVHFDKRGKGRANATPPRSSTTAEILIFTGVRYERQGGAEPTKPTASSGSRRKRG